MAYHSRFRLTSSIMLQRFNAPATVRGARRRTLTSVTLAALTACGGGGDGGGPPTATVTAMVASATKYGSTATITINGTGLDSTPGRHVAGLHRA